MVFISSKLIKEFTENKQKLLGGNKHKKTGSFNNKNKL